MIGLDFARRGAGSDRPAHRVAWRRVILAALGCLVMQGAVAVAHDGGTLGHHASEPARAAAANVVLHDLALTDQNQHSLKFKSEAIADRIVVMDFFYTSCGTTCPLTTALLTQVQDALGPRFGRDVRFLSISVDPVNDTPARLKAYARNHQLKPEWMLLTGSKASVDKVLEGLGAYTADFTDHPSMTIVGDAQRGDWKRLFGLPDKDRIMNILDALLAARD